MSGWTVATWAAIGMLLAGSLAVFAWFLRDALRMLRDRGRQRDR